MLNNENYGYLVHPLSQFMDDNLKPLTSAYLKVFSAGTSSSANTYSDWEGTLNTANIMLSMNGSANVIAEKNKAYKVMLCDALHPPSSPIWVKDNLYVISSEIEVIETTQIKDNARDDVTDPMHPDNITDIEQLIFVRNVGADANYTMVESEERTYGVLIPPPSMEADRGKVPMYKDGNQIGWEEVQNEDYETIEHILDLSTLDAENTTFNVVLTANHNNAISFVESSEQTAIVAIEIEDDKPYNIQIEGACTLAITGVEWWGDAITDITNKSEINIMNGRAMGVLIDV